MSDTKASLEPWRWATNGVGKTFVGSHLESADGVEIFSVDYGTPVSNPTDVRLIALAPAMASMLESLEWSDHGEDGRSVQCHECCYLKTEGHAPDCKLAAILSELRGP